MREAPRKERPATPDTHETGPVRRPVHGILSVTGGPDPAQPRPVRFEATDAGTIQLFTDPSSPKVRGLRRDPRASLVAVAPVGERERWVSVTDRTTIETSGAYDLVSRLFTRYWDDLHDPARVDELVGMLALDWLRTVLHPETVRQGLSMYAVRPAALRSAAGDITSALLDGALTVGREADLPLTWFPLAETAAAHDAVRAGNMTHLCRS